MKNGRPIRLALLDNDRCSAEMMALLIGRTIPEAHMLWVTDNPSLALERCLFDPRKPDILICDLMMDGLNGVRLTERIRQRNVQVGVIVVTSYDLATYGEDIACCGAQALISKRDFAATIREAVKSVFDGGTYPHGWGLHSLEETLHTVDAAQPEADGARLFSDRELAVLRLYAHRVPTVEIARRLGIGVETVYSYVKRAMRKVGVTRRGELLDYCERYHVL